MSALAEELLTARADSQQLTPPSERDSGFGVDEAYSVGAEVRRALEEQGYRTIGRKLGFTNTAIWERLGLSELIWAPIYDQTVVLGGDANPLRHALGGAMEPRIEVEVVVKLGAVPGAGATVEEVAAGLNWLAIGFEIVDSYYADWQFQCSDAVAAFGLHRALLVGKPRPAAEVEGLAERLSTFEVRLLREGEPAADGGGESVLGNPLRAVPLLVDILARQGEPALSPGDIVTTGTLTPALSVAPGESWQVEVSGLPLPGSTLVLEG